MWNQIEHLIQLSQQPLEEGEVDLARNPERRNYYRFLYHLTLWRKPKVALEIGVENGLAGIYIARAAEQYNGWSVGIDIQDIRVLKGVKNYYFILGDSTNVSTWNKLFEFCEEHGKIGIVYQDSSHHYDASRKEWKLYSQLMDENSFWVCDDITPAFHDFRIDPPGKGMVQYFEEFNYQKRLYPDVLHRGNCQGIIWIP